MNTDSTLELQKIDCNCNNCCFLLRDVEKFKQQQELHKIWQFNYFNTIKNKLLQKARFYHRVKNDLEVFENLNREADKMTFQFNKKEASLNYGICLKKNTKISFLPNILQLNTQDCFVHRSELTT